MLRAHTLSFSIAIFLFIFLMSSSLILLDDIYNTTLNSFLRKMQTENFLDVVQEIILVGKSEELAQFSEFKNNSAIPINVNYQITNWGVLEIATIYSIDQEDTNYRSFIIGYKDQRDKNVALLMEDNQLQLSVNGKVKLEGLIYSPGGVLKRAFINGIGLSKASIINIKLLKSPDTLPFLFKSHFPNPEYHFTSNQYVNPGDSFAQEFTNSTKFLELGSHSGLSDIHLKGNVVLLADSVFLDKTSNIDNIIIIANDLVIGNGFEGGLQVYAKRSVVLDSNSTLSYPSAILLDSDSSKVLFKAGSKLEGWLINSYQSAHIRMDQKSKIEGIVYSKGTLDFNGIIWGTVYCGQLEISIAGIRYKNLLIDSEISPYKISAFFSHPRIFSNQEEKVVMKWIKE